ncbi:MAG TPA: protein kinase [Polyangiales bacterium]
MSSAQQDGPETAADEARTASLPEAPLPASSDPLGSLVAERYTLDGLLGSGSLGRSYLAHDTDGRKVVVKLMHTQLASDEAFARRLKRELDGAAKLEHPHIARPLAHGTDSTLGTFAVRDFIDGDDLRGALAGGVKTPRRICELFIQLLGALSEAHRHGVLHKNLKPANVRVSRDANGRESVKVCDFGNPQRVRSDAAYVAPEQATGQAVDGQADVYAVGVMLFEALTDDVPFRAGSAQETLELHRTEVVPSPQDRTPDRPLPRELEAVCVKALAKNTGERHRSPREMSQALRAVVSLLGGRADEPLGSAVFAEGDRNRPASVERMTIPGEQLRSHTKFWLGAGLLVLVCATVLLSPSEEPSTEPSTTASSRASAKENGERALQSGSALLVAGDAEGAISDLRNARRALGDRADVLRALGEALLTEGNAQRRDEGIALLKRYLELEPTADDRAFVQKLLRHAEQK